MTMTMMIIDYLAKWGHFLAGITWIGLLYYFNFVQTEYFKEADPDARTDAFVKLAPRALWWFRWGAMLTLLTGLVMLWVRGANLTVDGLIGSVMAILMFLNVWLIIWPNQKILIASNEQIKGGGEALPEAAAAAPKAALASRTNTLFSIPMLYFMGSSAHLPNGPMGGNMTALIIILIIIAVLELNAIFGKPGPIATIKGVITSGFALWAVLLGLLLLLPESSSAPAAEPAATVEPAPVVEETPAMPAEEPPPLTEAAPAEEPAAMDEAAPADAAAPEGEAAAAMDEAAPAPEAAPPPEADPVADPDPTG